MNNITWMETQLRGKYAFKVVLRDEREAIKVDADVYRYLQDCGSRAVRSLEMARLQERRDVRDRFGMVYAHRIASEAYEVSVTFTVDAEAVAFKLKFC